MEIQEEKLQDYINDRYKYTEVISIDYAIMEKSENVYVIPSSFEWNYIEG